MAQKISQLTEIDQESLAPDDVFPISDISAVETKKIKVSELDERTTAKAAIAATAAVATHVALPDPHPQYTQQEDIDAAVEVVQDDLDAHEANTSNPHSVTKAQVGLGNADNTSDSNKPVSVAQAAAIASAQSAATTAAQATSLQKSANLSDLTSVPAAKGVLGITNVDNTSDANKPVSVAQAAADAATLASAESYTDGKVAALVNVAPSTLDTLKELADALGDDPNFAGTTATALGNRVRVDTAAQGLNGTQKTNAKTNLDLQNVDNTSDANKPVSTLQAASIATKLTDPMTTDGDLIARLGGAPARVGVGLTDQILRVIGGVPTWADENLGQDFGGKGDGNYILSGLLTLTAPAYFDTLTLMPGGVLVTNGYPVYGRVLNATNADAGAIRWNGNNGATPTLTTGASGGAGLTAAMLGGAGAGSAGSSGTATNSAQATAPTGVSPSNGGAGGAGGLGGAGSGGTGGAVRAGATIGSPVPFDRFEINFLRGGTPISGGAGGAGGSAGGGNTTVSGRGGGGGGGGAGVMALYFQEIITGPLTPAGVIQAKGGNGGNGSTSGVVAADIGGGAAGGGGGGGYIYLAFLKRTGTPVADFIDASGGIGGSGGNATGTGIGGSGGTGGSGGRIRVFDTVNSTSVRVIGSAGNAGGAAAGTVGGAAGSAGSCKLTF